MRRRRKTHSMFLLRPGFARRAAFAMVEVVVAMTILGIAVVAIMKSLTQSLQSARIQEQHTMALFLARQMMDEFELNPPETGDKTGGFGDAYKNYFYKVHTKIDEPDYKTTDVPDEIDTLYALRSYTLEIVYQDTYHPDDVLLRIDSACVGFEKFSFETKRAYYEF